MSVHTTIIEGLVTRSREYEGQRLLHTCIASPFRAIDLKEGVWDGMLITLDGAVGVRMEVYGEGTTTYADENGRRIVIIAGERIDEDDHESDVLRVSRNEFIFSIPSACEKPREPAWLTNESIAGSLRVRRFRIRSGIRFAAQTADFKAHLEFQKWFSDMHDKMMPMKGESYSKIWKQELDVAQATRLTSGCWLPFEAGDVRGVLRIDRTRDDLFDATGYYVDADDKQRSIMVGNQIARTVCWDDKREQVRIGTVEECLTIKD